LPDGKTLKIMRSEPCQVQAEDASLPGTIWAIEKGHGFIVKCKKGCLAISKVQLEGKKQVDAWSFLQGSRLKMGDRLQ
jgi:methionyl-tRNA formyltransferase